jgi:methyl-accepting chemotaxis protein/CHASE3 domain sensor protein
MSQSQGITAVFTNRKIATKIAIGFACILAITAVLSAIAYTSFVKVGHSFEAFNQRVAVVGLARDVELGFASFRRYAREFLQTGNENYFRAAIQRRDTLRALVARSLAEIKNPERLSKMKHLSDELEAYARNFDKAVGLRREQDKLVREVLDPAGALLATEMDQLQAWAAKAGNAGAVTIAGDAFKHLMQARLSANKVIARHDQPSADAADKSFTALKSAMTALSGAINTGDVRKLFDETNANLIKYTDAYKTASHDAHEVEKLVNGDMSRQAQAIATDVEAVKNSGIAEEKQIEQETQAEILATERFILMLALGGIALGALLAWLIGRSISVPTRAIGGVLVELSNGNKAVDVPYADRGDEVGDNARAALQFKENLLRIEKMEAEQKEGEQRAAAQRKADMHKLADDFQQAVGNIVDTVSAASTELEAAAGTLTKTAEVTQELSGAVAAASEQASANVQSVASATEEMTSSVNEISRQVQESSKIAGEAVRQAQQTDVRINQLSQAAGRIGDVVKLITAIAEQTNLLALNATIEAARAGEAGRGFAVVASEVKQLASQTAKATDEISTQIAGMQTATQDSVAAIKEIGGTIGRISEIASTIAAAVEEQGAATQEIARNVGEAAKGTQQVAGNITDVNRGAGETGSASAQVLSSAQSLSGESNHLKAEVEKFLMTVRAA